MRSTLRVCAVITAAGLIACAGPSDSPQGRVHLDVAPLSLSGLTDADYTVTVTNGGGGGGETVWSKALSSSRYGDSAGSLAYVGTCDASTGVNTVTVTLDALYDASGAIDPASYDNPGALSKEVVCEANADVDVTFDLTVVREAQQGFFDVAVSFEDIFCSAKLDCETGSGDDLELLHNPATGARDMTAVFGLACTGSPSGDTFLYMDDLVVSCTGLALDVRVDPTGIGNLDTTAAPSANADGYLYGATVFRGVEGFAGKAYWNVSLGLDETTFAVAGDCTLVGRATASSEPFPQELLGFPLPEGSVYPVIDWSVPLTNATGRVCTTHAVNEAGSGVETSYLGYLPALNQFTWGAEPIYLDARFEPVTGVVLRAAAAICNPSCVHGSCAAPDTCDCTDTGYSGATCDTPVCTTPCENGGVCVAPDTCDCTGTGYGGATCAGDVDECAAGTDNCDPDAICANTAGGFTCTCPAGFYGDGTSCTACGDGEVQPDAGQAACVVCPAGTYDDGSEVCAACADGDVQPLTGQTSCTACPAGSYDDGTEVCAACADGSVQPSAGSLSCTACPAGSYDDGTEVCAACAEGDVQPVTGQTSCTACPAGSYDDGSEVCAACADGDVQPSAGSLSCTACPAGSYDDGTEVCAACAAGAVQPSAGSTSCTVCPAGTYDDGGEVCAACPDGGVQPDGGQVTCNSCTPGTYDDGTEVCASCAAGEVQPGFGATSCLACDPGTYDDGSETCASCPSGEVQPSSGQTSCTVCSAGTYDDGSEVCAACPDGGVQPDSGQVTCNSCTPGTYDDGTEVCASCAAGEVQPGFGATSCLACDPGTYDNGSETCASCADGEVQPDSGQTSCLACAPGSYDDGTELCASCADGYVQPNPGSLSCTVCSAGTYDDGSEVCAACDAGSVQPSAGQTSCTACPASTYDDGTEVCATCDACASGEYLVSACGTTADTVCATCTAVANCVGSVTCTTSSNSVCSACKSGYTQLAAGAACTDVDECAAGTDGCDENAACANTVGGYTCTCAGGASYGDGTSCAYATSCLDLVQTAPATTTGVYWLDHDGVGGDAAFEAYCEMDTDGGGWTLAMTSSDDGVTTWTYNNHTLMTTDETLVGSASAVTHDYKGLAHHRLAFTALLFVHAPSGVWAEYGVDSGGADLGSFIDGVAYPNCPTSGNLGYELVGGNLAVDGTAPELCETDLYFNLGDADGGGAAHCALEGTTAWNGTWGPVWNMNNNEGCNFDDPGAVSLGPSAPCDNCGTNPDVESTGRGYGFPLGLNTGSAGTAANRMQVFLRDYPLRDCLQWKDADPAAASGVYTIDPDGLAGATAPFDVYCDMGTEGGGWTLLVTSSDDGAATFTYNNKTLLTSNTTEVGSPTQPSHDLKSLALHTLPFTSLLFRHQPSTYYARYGLDSGGVDFGTFLGAQPEPSCPSAPGGYPMLDGDLTVIAGNPQLCDTDLYFNLGDQDGQDVSIALCLDQTGGSNQDAFGPGWNAGVNNGCDFDDPGGFGLGPIYNVTNTTPNTENNGRGFASALGLNTGTAGAAQNYIQAYARDYPLRSCNEWRGAGRTEDAVYTIDPDGYAGVMPPFDVYCDMTTEGGGWTEIPYAADLPYQMQFAVDADAIRWLPSNFTVAMTAARIDAIKAVSTEGRQEYVGLCDGVIHYLYSPSDYSFAFGFRFWDGTETARGVADYTPLGTEPYTITVTQDGCATNGGEGGTLANATIFDIRSPLVPVLNVQSRDNGNSGELFGSPLTSNSAWLR